MARTSPPVTAKNLSAHLDVTLSKRASRYFDSREWEHYQGFWGEVRYDKPMRLSFLGPKLADYDSREFEHGDGWVPLARIGREESRFVAIKVTDEQCPVALWEPDTKQFVPHAESLDLFLKSLGETASKAQLARTSSGALEALVEFSNKATALLDRAPTKANIAACHTLHDASARWFIAGVLPREKPLKGSSYAVVPSQAVYHLARLQHRIGKHAEALRTLRETLEDGQPMASAPELECELLLALGQPREALELFEATEEDWSSDRLKGLLLYKAGRVEEALKTYRSLIAMWADSTLSSQRKPRTRAEVEAGHLQDLIKYLERFAQLNQVECASLVARLEA